MVSCSTLGSLRSLLVLACLLPATPAVAEPVETAHPTPAAVTPDPAIPEALQPWVPWVMEQGPERRDTRACPLDARGGIRLCAWPGVLELALDARGGRFEQAWELQAEDWVPLPGDADVWPLDVQEAERALPVVARAGRPAVKLEAGRHRISGRFQWERSPESLQLPSETALLTLALEGQPPAPATPDQEARLWLRDPGQSAGEREGERLRLEVHRRIEDSLPLQVLTRIELDAAGRAREVRLGPVLLPGGIPLRLTSPLPTRLEQDGTLRVQVRPGRWVLEIASHHPGEVTRLSRARASEPWPEREVWAFVARPELRQVERSGLQPLDPSQTRLPADWARLPVYAVGPEDAMQLTEQRRGDADPEPDRLRLERELWLDFDGQGYSARDQLSGELTRSWRLEVGPELDLGQVRLDGSPLLITRLTSDSAPGVEVRRGRLNLVADSRLETPPRQLPASGWALALDGARARLHLPPGWDLLAVSGVDNVPETWLTRWTLLDLFLVLILTLGVGRLWGAAWGALALAALVLTWHAPEAPRLVWLHLLAATALLRLSPERGDAAGARRWRWLVLWYRRLALLALLLIGLPFLVSEVRDGFYPHLAQPQWTALDSGISNSVTRPAFFFEKALSESEPEALAIASDRLARAPDAAPAAPPPRILEQLDPKALVQTGPGIPNWQWRPIELSWTGPVGASEQARLWLLTPGWGLALSLLGALLVVLLGLRLADAREPPRPAMAAPALLLVLLVGTGLAPGPALAGDFPSPELLRELRERLLAPPDCLPECVTLSQLALRVEPAYLTLDLTLESAADMAAEVLAGRPGWSPTKVMLDGVVFERLRRGTEGEWLVPLTPGRHRLRLAGPLGAGNDSVDLPLALTPRQVVFAAEPEGWRLEGLEVDGPAGRQIQLIRIASRQGASDQPLIQDAPPPLLLVERRLELGLDWRVETVARRLSAPEFPLLVQVPLLPGESVQTPDIQVDGERVAVALMAGQTERRWSSSLAPVGALELAASEDWRLAESWHLDLAPIWHLDHAGIPPIHQRGQGERWLPSWRPRPGERLQLRITRPEGVPGPTLTIDRVDYQVEPGRRGGDASLTLIARGTQGGVHAIQLPEGVEPRRLTLDGRVLPLPGGQTRIELPLVPGTQEVRIDWRSDRPLTTGFSPAVPDLGVTAVNLNQTLRLPADRWVLLALGPGIGPAVLFWGLLVVLVGLSIVLGRVRITPLRWHDWLLLGIGLSLSEVWVGLLVAGWLLALGWRRRLTAPMRWWRFDLLQVGLVLLTVAALTALIGAVQLGLLGRPEMQILGNGSSASVLNWYQDRGGPRLPEVWVLSVPLWVYRALMLGWALWLALRLLDWLRWGWEGFSRPQAWLGRPRKAERASRRPSRLIADRARGQ